MKYPDDYLDKVLWGDCLKIMKDIPDGSVDAVITSPPYNMGLTPGGNGKGMYRASKNCKAKRFYNGYDGQYHDAMPIKKYNEWQREFLSICWGKIKDTGAIFYNHRPRIEHGKVRLPLNFDFGLPLHQIITWDRLTGIGVNLRHYCSAYEWVFVFSKKDFKLKNHSASGQSDMWNLGMEYGETGHPAPFPLALPIKILETIDAQIVLDPFLGSGTTAVAAKQLGRHFIGIELSKDYCEIANKRLEAVQLALGVLST